MATSTDDNNSRAPESEPAPALVVPPGPPFGPSFFLTVLADRVREQCDLQPESIPVVELHLGDGVTLDLCHVAGLGPQWVGAQFYRDRETCTDMDVAFVPYGLITRVTLSMWHRSQRPIGFDLEHPVTWTPALTAAERGAEDGAA
jgi:hypothetical protein